MLHALLVILAVPLLLARLPTLLACVKPTPTELLATLHALHALVILPLLLAKPLLPLAIARLTFTVLPKPLLAALRALTRVPLMLSHPQLPLPLLPASALSAPTELTPVLDVPLALMVRLPPLMVRLSLLIATSVLSTISEMVPYAPSALHPTYLLEAVLLALPPPCPHAYAQLDSTILLVPPLPVTVTVVL